MEVEGILFSAQETCFFTYRGEALNFNAFSAPVSFEAS